MPTEHVTIQHSECHEPRHISVSGSNDAGKVITSSDSAAGVSVYRFLEGDEIASSNGPQGYTLISNGDGTTSWASSSAVYGFSHDITGTGVGVDLTDPIAINVTHQSSNTSAGSTWGNGANYLTIPENGTYRISFSVSLSCSEIAHVGAMVGTAAPATISDMFRQHIDAANDVATVSGVYVGTYTSGNQIRMYGFYAPDSAPGMPVSLNAFARSLYVEKIG